MWYFAAQYNKTLTIAWVNFHLSCFLLMRIQWSHWKGHTRTNKKLVVKGQGLVIFVHRVLFLCVFFPLFCAFLLVIWFYMFHPFHKHTSACSSWNSISPYTWCICITEFYIKIQGYSICTLCALCTLHMQRRFKVKISTDFLHCFD